MGAVAVDLLADVVPGSVHEAFPVARGLDETGDHFVLMGEIEKGGIRPDGLIKEYVDVRHVKKIAVEIDRSVVSAHELQSRISNALREAGTTVYDIFSEWKSIYVDYSGRLQKAQIDNAD